MWMVHYFPSSWVMVEMGRAHRCSQAQTAFQCGTFLVGRAILGVHKSFFIAEHLEQWKQSQEVPFHGLGESLVNQSGKVRLQLAKQTPQNIQISLWE